MLADPGLVIVKPIEMDQEIHIAVEGEQRVFGQWMKRSEKNARPQKSLGHGIALSRRFVGVVNRTASQNATHVSFVSACTVRASWEHPCDRDHQLMMERRDRVGNVALGSDRRRRGVGNYREWQVF